MVLQCVLQRKPHYKWRGERICYDNHIIIEICAGYGWDKVNILHSSSCSALFWICVKDSTENTVMF